MRSIVLPLFLVSILSLVLNGCVPSPSSTATPVASFVPTATITPIPKGKLIVVASTSDSGSGTLRQALLEAQSGDTITFDSAAFPPNAPVTIYLTSGLPHISQGELTIDASNAGIILDGSNITEGDWICGLTIVSNSNTVWGLQIINFSGAGIDLEGANYNTIGGDRHIGSGPIGQGNLISGNNGGILLFGASDNLIMGNLIGTDVTSQEAFANQDSGIAIQSGAMHNTIGPDNIIAYNAVFGIDLRDLSPYGNTITQNSIHDNAHLEIHFPGGVNAKLLPPIIFEFDLSTGIAMGSTCANCTVEIFSDDDRDGEFYEGRTKADDAGFFSFRKKISFADSHLTATVTDMEGNTNGFSRPTMGVRGSLTLQEENILPGIQLEPKRSNGLEDNRIGGFWTGLGGSDELQDTLEVGIIGQGITRVRLAINAGDSDLVDWNKPELSVDPIHEDFFTAIANNDIKITYVLSFWDKATWPGGERENHPRFKTEEEIQRYLDFVRFIIQNFENQVQYFEIWNEPDVTCEESILNPCVQAIDVEDYINLVRRVVPVIREEYPEAKIQVGGTCHLIVPESREYLFSILKSDIMPLVDVVSWHPMFGISPENNFTHEQSVRQYYYEYPFIVQQIMDVASAHGFEGEYEADEVTWETPETADFNIEFTHSETIGAKYYARSIMMHLSMDVTVVAGGTSDRKTDSYNTIRNLSTVMAGAKPVNLPVEIESETTDILSYTFTLSNGDYLVALWTDGVAVDNDPGVTAIITLPEFSSQEAIGIDVLNGFQQQLVTSIEDGNLVIHDLLVKDYPIILRFTDASSP